MKRREFITLLGGAAATWPVVARAQQPERMKRVGLLIPGDENDSEIQARVRAFRQEFQKAGWTEGHNVWIDYRWTHADPELTRIYAAELVGLTPDVILAGSNQATTILSQQTRSIPIVFAGASDPLGTGLIANMAHPGANITGFTQLEIATSGKWLELLKEAVPRLTHVLIFHGNAAPGSLASVRLINAAAPSLGVRTTTAPTLDPAEIERAIEAMAREPDGGLIVLSSPANTLHRGQIISLAARHHLPAAYPYRFFTTDGGLMSYGPSIDDQYRWAASYVDRILKGEKPGDLPVQAPTKYELIVNLKTARALGLTIPESFLLRADEVIE